MQKICLLVICTASILLGCTTTSADSLKEGDTFFFGKYEQDDIEENGEESIEW